jgi:hypothetical protein
MAVPDTLTQVAGFYMRLTGFDPPTSSRDKESLGVLIQEKGLVGNGSGRSVLLRLGTVDALAVFVVFGHGGRVGVFISLWHGQLSCGPTA